MAGFDLSQYVTVDDRLKSFWKDHPNGRVLTELKYQDERRFIVYAEIFFDLDDLSPRSTGHAEEIVGVGMVNKSSALENCETSAIGRALANCNYSGGKERASLEEIQKVERYKESPRKPAAASIKPTEEQIKKITKLYDDISVTSDVDTLRQWFKTEAALLDLPVGGTTVRDALTKKAESVK